MKWRRWAYTLVLASSFALAETMEGFQITDAWIREAPPVVSALAGYARIQNQTDEAAVLVGASSEDFAAVEFHRSEIVDGLARMREVSSVAIPPRTVATFEPGALHMMLFKPRRAFKVGDLAALKLLFDDGRLLQIEAPILRKAPAK